MQVLLCSFKGAVCLAGTLITALWLISHEVNLAHFNPNKNCGMDMNALMFKHSSVDLLHATKKSALENLPMWASSYFDLCGQKLKLYKSNN